MPTLPCNTKCSMLGCRNERTKLSGLCLEHGGKNTYVLPKSNERKEFNKAYDSGWRKLREAQLSKSPLCQSCLSENHIRSANHVDHLFAWNSVGKEAFYRNIFQSLCHDCHSHKTALEQRGIFRHYQGSTHTDYALSDYSRVVGEAFRNG
jgi:5-methylcytosine-specific restriction protein A